eukprot:COSAG01_NODE_308_length_19148_cov_13.076697_8_plen_48_part_00
MYMYIVGTESCQTSSWLNEIEGVAWRQSMYRGPYQMDLTTICEKSMK